MTKPINQMNSYLDRLETKIKSGMGRNFLVMLDTCAVIDFEHYANNWRLKDKNKGISAFYTSFCSRGFPVYVNKRVIQEVFKHRNNHSVAGRDEVSAEGATIVNQMYLNYQRFMQTLVESNPKKIEDIRYDVYWATKLAFDPDHKKICDDLISRVDKSIIAAATWARYANLIDGAYLTDLFFDSAKDGTPVRSLDGVVIVSPDAHLSETVRVLTDHTIWPDCQDQLFIYDSIKVVSSRED